jgi:hypothetical protein
MLVLSTPAATVGLIVRGGEVVETAPYSRRYLGRNLNAVLAHAWRGRRITVSWLPNL